MERLGALHQETVLLLQALRRLDEQHSNRDQIIQQIQTHIDNREEMISHVTDPYTKEEIKLGKQIVILNEEIKNRMNRLYQVIKKDMKQVQRRKEQNYSYINPYGKIKTTDGLYMDRKS